MPGGRPKGSIDRRGISAIRVIRDAYPNYDPLRAMIECAKDPNADLALKFAAHKEIAQYMYPKRKAVELSGDGGGPLEFDIVIRPHKVIDITATDED